MRWFGRLFATGLIAVGVGPAGSTVVWPRSDTPSLWFKCPTGAKLEVVGAGARCTFAPVVVLEPAADCELGWWVVVDGASKPAGADACSNGTQTVRRTCGATLVVVPKGLDRCERVSSRSAEPPKIPVRV